MNKKKATQTNPFCPLLFFGSHLNPLQHFLDLFPFSKCLLSNHFGKWTTFFHCLFFVAPHHALRLHLGGYSNKYVRWISFKSKNPPSTNSNKKSTNFSTSTCWSTFAYVYFFSTCSSSLESLIIMIIDVGGEKCLQSLCNVSSNPSPIVATHCKASKISLSMFLSPKLSLLSWNTWGSLDANSSM